MAQPTWKPWHQVVKLRDDLKTGELSLAVFAADLYDVIMQKGSRPIYEDPSQFFALTYPTLNLRELVKDVMTRLAGKNDKAIRQLELTYGGGKTHTLITLRHLVNDPAKLPDLPAVHEFEAHIGARPPKARVVALCFDKFDVEKGIETRAPDGSLRVLKHPWSAIAYQIAGDEGLKLIHANGKAEERETPPAEPLLVELLSRPHKDGLSTLVLIDEVLMYAREKVGLDPVWRGRLVDFFQYLTQAVVKVDRCALVASLLASDPAKSDAFGKELIAQIFEIFGRQREEAVQPVQKEDVAEVLRRRFFKPESIRDINAFRPHVTTAVNNIAELDEQTKKGRKTVEERFLASYPFHPDLTEILYAKWTEIDAFQKTRGVLRLFAIALRDAEKWDTAPLVGPNVFLPAPGKADLSDALRELASIATSESGAGKTQQWVAILPGELEKAQVIEAERTGLKNREIEQAVCAVFLHSQPIGKKALTRELMVLLGTTRPDKIELEKGLRRWTETSWFLDEVEAGTAETLPDGTKQLPKAWRLGDRPNLRQMHHDACTTRVPPELIETKLVDEIERHKSLTAGATAAGASVHLLPGKPNDVEDNGEFHFAVLGPKAASESGKPSPEARRFIDETTAADRPRVYRNAVVLAAPSKDGLEAARMRIRDYLGWEEVKAQLRDQAVDPIREEMLNANLDASRKAIPEAIRQAYCIVVTVNEANEIHAFKITVGADPLFNTIKADKRSRIQDTPISSEAMLPGGPYDLWRAGETSRRVKDLVGAFAQFPKLPKMLRVKEILDTVVLGVQDGIWVARVVRPDRSVKTYWRTAIDENGLKDPGLEVLLSENGTLTEIAPDLLLPGCLPGLWEKATVAVGDVLRYFAGGHAVKIQKEGYEETLTVPWAEPSVVEAAIAQAVEQGKLWLTSGPASILGEPIPTGVLTPTAELQHPPASIAVDQIMAAAIPDAWKDGKTTALAISAALSTKLGKNLPWQTIQNAIDSALRARWVELGVESGSWPCGVASAQHVVLQVPAQPAGGAAVPPAAPRPQGILVAEATLPPNGIQDLADVVPELLKAAVGHELKFGIRVELGGAKPPTQETVESVNKLLNGVSRELRLT